MDIIPWVVIGVVGIIAIVAIVKLIKGCLLKFIIVGFLIALAAFLVCVLLLWR